MAPQQTTGKALFGDYVVVIHGVPLIRSDDSWKSVKDLLRKIHLQKPDVIYDEPGTVNLHTLHGYCYYSCSIKSEKAAKKSFTWLAGNEWYGYRLTVWLWSGGKILSHSGTAQFDQPIRLELISPIKDRNLIRQMPPIPSAFSPPTRDSMTVQSQYPTHFQTIYTNSSFQSPYNPQGFHSPSSSVPSQYSTASMTALFGASSSVENHVPYYPNSSSTNICTFQNLPSNPQMLEQYALQAFMNHVPGRNGEVFKAVSVTNSPTWAAPSLTAAVSYTRYNTPLLQANPIAYTMPVGFMEPATSHPYHANPDGTLVNITRGIIQVNESRAVLVRNLNHRASPEDVRTHFSTVGLIQHCDISTSRKEKRKCTGRLTFSSAQEAKEAVKRFNNSSFMGRDISLEVAKDDSMDSSRIATEAAATTARTRASPGNGPVIVNGNAEDPWQQAPASHSQNDDGEAGNTYCKVDEVVDEMKHLRMKK